jgi:hypothetical protein
VSGPLDTAALTKLVHYWVDQYSQLQRWHSEDQQRFALATRLQLVTFRLLERAEIPNDWACRQCKPESDMLREGFRCHYHEAQHLLVQMAEVAR